MNKIRMKCDRCPFEEAIHTSDKDETEAKVPFYRCPECGIGSLKPVENNESD